MPTPRAFLETLRIATRTSPLPAGLDRSQVRHFEQLRAVMADPNVVGIGVAEKRVGDERVGTRALTFYVREKRPLSDLRGGVSAPRVVASPKGRALFTDVVQVGEVLPHVAAINTPIGSGYSVAHRGSAPGTLGAIVRRAGQPMVLSNAHVLARSGLAAPGDAILYPAAADGGVDPANRIATLAAVEPIVGGGLFVNRFDAALAAIAADRVAEIDATIAGAALPIRLAKPTYGMRIRIRGRSTPQAQSVVRDADAYVQVPYSDVGLAGFSNQCLCDPYAAEGDSGAVVVDVDTGAVVGLHFAGSSEASYFSPILPIAKALNFTF